MQSEMPLEQQILRDACDKFGYKFEIVDPFTNAVSEVSNGRKSFFSSPFRLGMYPLNCRSSAQLVNDKAWTGKILKSKGYKVPEGSYFYLSEKYRNERGDGQEWEDAYDYAEKLGYPVFVKPNGSSFGIYAESVENRQELEQHLQNVASLSYIAVVQQKIDLPEYRIFVLDGEPQFAYQRSFPKIIGDGEKTIWQLIEEMNERIQSDYNKINRESGYLKRKLAMHDYDFETVLDGGSEFQVMSKANIAAGGSIISYVDQFSEKTKKWCQNLCKDMAIRTTGLDVFVANGLDDPENFTIIELNQNPQLNGIYNHGKTEKVLEIWGKIMEKYFES